MRDGDIFAVLRRAAVLRKIEHAVTTGAEAVDLENAEFDVLKAAVNKNAGAVFGNGRHVGEFLGALLDLKPAATG